MSDKKDSAQLQPIDLIDLCRRFFHTARRLWLLLIVLALLCSALFTFRAYRSYRPYYESTALFSVNSGYAPDDIFSTSFYDNLAAQQLAEAFPHMLQMELMQDLMRQHLDVPYINGSISAVCVANTNMFWLTVRSNSAQDAYDILWAVIDCFPQVAVYMVDNPQVVIRNEPTVAETPYNSFSWRGHAVKGFAVGIMLSMALVLLVSLLTKTVSNASQLKSLVNLPLLSSIPLVPVKKRRKGTPRPLSPGSKILEEPLQGLNLTVRKQLESGNRQVVAVTSTVAGEGKTTVAAGMALSMAGAGYRVALLDADLRNQSVASRFRGQKSPNNLIDCLRNPELPVKEQLIQVGNSGLYYLSGKSMNHLHYNIDSNEFRRILDALAADFDYIVMDTAPCGLVSDTANLARHADCMLYVVKRDHVLQNRLLDAVQDLYDQDVQITGIVFNGVPMGQSHYGYKYGYKYGYGHKYGYGYSRNSRN